MDTNNNVKCPDCDTTVKLGSVGMANLAHHRGSEKCKANKKKSNNAKTLEKLQSSMRSFRPKLWTRIRLRCLRTLLPWGLRTRLLEAHLQHGLVESVVPETLQCCQNALVGLQFRKTKSLLDAT